MSEEIKLKEKCLNDGGSLELVFKNSLYGVYSNRSRIMSRDFKTKRKALNYFKKSLKNE